MVAQRQNDTLLIVELLCAHSGCQKKKGGALSGRRRRALTTEGYDCTEPLIWFRRLMRYQSSLKHTLVPGRMNDARHLTNAFHGSLLASKVPPSCFRKKPRFRQKRKKIRIRMSPKVWKTLRTRPTSGGTSSPPPRSRHAMRVWS